MTADRWTRIETIFLGAVEHAPTQRGSFLDQACADDADLRREVDSLLRHAERSGGVLSAPAAEWARQIAAAYLPPGRRLGPYEVQGFVGAGGMGEVYVARDARLDRQVALKLLPEALMRDRGWTLRFEREARALSALNHPNIVTVHDVGEADGRPWMATELVRGVTLRERMARGPLPPGEVVAVFRQVLAALAAAHEAGLVHRDVKPENIMVRPDGIVKLLDFGLAKTVQPGGNLTGDGVRLGTIRYMSPEQLAGGDVGLPSDVWSAGVVLAEMLGGADASPATPFRGVLAKALARAPDQRYATAGQMLAALDESQPRRWLRLGWWPSAAVVALVFMALLAPRWPWREAEPFQQTEVRRIATLSRGLHAALSPDGAFLAYTDDDADRHTLWLQQMNGSPPRPVAADAPHGFAGLAFSPDGYLYYAVYDASRFGQLYRLPLVGGGARPILRDIDSPPGFAPDGTRMAFIRHDNRRGATSLVVSAVDGSAERVIGERHIPLAYSTAGCAFSPDGRKVVVAANVRDAGGAARAALLEVDAATGTTRERGSGRWSWIGSVASAGSRGLVFPAVVIGSQTTEIVLLSWSDRESVINTASAQGGFLRVSATADGRQVLAIHRDRQASVLLAARDRLDAPRRLTAAGGAFYDLAFGPPPDLVAQLFTGIRPGIVRIARDGSVEPLLTGNRMGRTPATAPAGDTVVFVSERDGLDQIWRADANGTAAVPLTGGPGRSTAPACCTADGRVVFLSDVGGYPALWSVPLKGGAASPLSTRPALRPALDATGTRLAWVDLEAPDAAARQVVVAPMAALEQRKPVVSVPADAFVRWNPGGPALTFVQTKDGVSNLWDAPLDGGPARPLTRFTEEVIFGFDWSRDGREAALLRGSASSELLLIRERKE